MLKNGFRNYFKNLVHIFVPMGIIYFFLIVTSCWWIAKMVSLVSVMLGDTVALAGGAAQGLQNDLKAFFDYAADQVGTDSSSALKIFDENWLNDLVTGFFETQGVSMSEQSEGINTILETFAGNVIEITIEALGILCSGFVLSNAVTGLVIRHKTAKTTIKQFLLYHILSPLFFGAALMLSTWLGAILEKFAIIAVLIIVVIYMTSQIILSWLVYRKNGLKLLDVLSVKNVASSILLVLVLLILDAVLFFLFALFSLPVALLLILPFIIYTFSILSANTRSFVYSLAEEKGGQ